jgi:selenocysteine-specific elongation factor
MKSVIIGTAGHIDHGKTALVKALTGIDADRLEEEKRRGITIDIGFAHLDLPAPDGQLLHLGFVDVPGHERFVRNMLAGVGGIDLILLIIAADESIKPQTREHFEICRLLAIQRGITVLTKSDLVDRETLEVVRLEVGEFLRSSVLDPAQAPIIAVSSSTGSGLDELRRALVEAATKIPARDSKALARLPIDRVFTMKGFGTVVTGTLVSGTIRRDEELEVFPLGRRVRVRGVQVHSHVSEQALAGQRTALNLAGASKEELARGMSLAPPSIFHSTIRADVSLKVLPSAKPFKDRARVHFHCYTSETIATVVLDQQQALTSGKTGFAQLRFADSILLLPGDRFIIRQFSPVVTIGGGLVLDAQPLPKIDRADKKSFLRILAQNDPAAILKARIARRAGLGLSLSLASAETGWTRSLIEAHLRPLLKNRLIIQIGELLVEAEAIEQLKRSVSQNVTDFHRQNPLVPGMSKEALREKMSITPEVLAFALDSLSREEKLEIAGELLRLPGHNVVMQDDEAESKAIIERAFASAGLRVPSLKDVLAGLRVDRVRAQKIVTLLLRDKILLKVSEDLVFHRTAMENLRGRLRAEKEKSPRMDVARFKGLTGVSRKYAIPLLEYLDREHVTRRVGDERVIL